MVMTHFNFRDPLRSCIPPRKSIALLSAYSAARLRLAKITHVPRKAVGMMLGLMSMTALRRGPMLNPVWV